MVEPEKVAARLGATLEAKRARRESLKAELAEIEREIGLLEGIAKEEPQRRGRAKSGDVAARVSMLASILKDRGPMRLLMLVDEARKREGFSDIKTKTVSDALSRNPDLFTSVKKGTWAPKGSVP